MSKCCLYGNLNSKVYKINHIYVVWWLFKEAIQNYLELLNEGNRPKGDRLENTEQVNWSKIEQFIT